MRCCCQQVHRPGCHVAWWRDQGPLRLQVYPSKRHSLRGEYLWWDVLRLHRVLGPHREGLRPVRTVQDERILRDITHQSNQLYPVLVRYVVRGTSEYVRYHMQQDLPGTRQIDCRNGLRGRRHGGIPPFGFRIFLGKTGFDSDVQSEIGIIKCTHC